MTEGELTPEAAQELKRSLLHKEGNWVDWGKACQKLQKAGYHPQSIFEETGFQGSQQNLVIVAAQVYESIAQGAASSALLNYFLGPYSDVLYELRILNNAQRLETAQLAMDKQLNADLAKEVAKAVQEMSRLSQLPASFSRHPGDAIAYQCWRRARQKKDLQERSRLIAQGLKFAYSSTAREAVEKLLSDFTVVPTVEAPLLPLYRLEAEEELPRLIPIAGTLPLAAQTLMETPTITIEEPFRSTQINSPTHLVAIPGWQAILKAIDPVAILASSDLLPQTIANNPETVLVVVDRQVTDWDVYSYFVVEESGNILIRWFESSPTLAILGKIILILRPKRILDEGNLTQPWQMDD